MNPRTVIINIGSCGCGRKRKFNVTCVKEIPRRKEPTMVATGNHFWDKFLLQMSVAPDGVLDAVPSWTCDDPGVTLTPDASGLNCVAQADSDISAFAVTVTAPADNPSTPELESVSETFTGSFSHSKATALSGSFSEIPR